MQHGCHLLYVAHIVDAQYGIVLAVGFVGRHSVSRSGSPLLRVAAVQTDVAVVVLTQVTQREDVSCMVVRAAFVGYPHLYTVDCHAASYVRQRLHGCLVLVAEEVTEEEVSVLIVVGYAHLELCHLCAAFAADTLALAVLL